jgi:hypothetical protein
MTGTRRYGGGERIERLDQGRSGEAKWITNPALPTPRCRTYQTGAVSYSPLLGPLPRVRIQSATCSATPPIWPPSVVMLSPISRKIARKRSA